MAQSSEEVANEVALRRLDSQMQRVDTIDSRIGVVLGLAGTALGIFAGFIAIVVDPDNLASIIFAAVSGAIILIVYLLAMWNGLLVSTKGEWDERPNWDELLLNASKLELPAMHQWIAQGCVMSLQENEAKLQSKTSAAAAATRLALVVAIFVAFALIGLFLVTATFG